MNNFNKLFIEIYSKLDYPIKISKLHIKFSESKLNYDFDFYVNEINDCKVFDKDHPIILEHQFFIEEKQIAHVGLNNVFFNKIDLFLTK